jgi:lipopolysaccharide/colanic/teichoic acid biosynthesis glycosyltransferase
MTEPIERDSPFESRPTGRLRRNAGDRRKGLHAVESLRAGPYLRFVKPVFDLLGGAFFTIATLPLVFVVVLTIWSTMGRPAILRQRRVGRGGRVFDIYKFRTMDPDRRRESRPWDGPDRRVVHKTPDDPRHTLVGRFLRKWSIDEIPQFWNVLLGQMSLVGPRPELVGIVETKYEPWQHRRHTVKPGVTGLWQVTARNDGPLMHECTEIDLQYVDHITFLGDMRLLLQTLPSALGHHPRK